MVSELLDEPARGQADGLERDLRGRTDGEIRNRMPRKASQARVAEREQPGSGSRGPRHRSARLHCTSEQSRDVQPVVL